MLHATLHPRLVLIASRAGKATCAAVVVNLQMRKTYDGAASLTLALTHANSHKIDCLSYTAIMRTLYKRCRSRNGHNMSQQTRSASSDKAATRVFEYAPQDPERILRQARVCNNPSSVDASTNQPHPTKAVRKVLPAVTLDKYLKEAEAKEQLYRCLTGLTIHNHQKGNDGFIYHCSQTERRGSMIFTVFAMQELHV